MWNDRLEFEIYCTFKIQNYFFVNFCTFYKSVNVSAVGHVGCADAELVYEQVNFNRIMPFLNKILIYNCI